MPPHRPCPEHDDVFDFQALDGELDGGRGGTILIVRRVGRHEVGHIAENEDLSGYRESKIISGAARESQQEITRLSGDCPSRASLLVALALFGVTAIFEILVSLDEGRLGMTSFRLL